MKYLSVYFCIIFFMISCSSPLHVFNGIKSLLRGLPTNGRECFKNRHHPLHKFNAWARTSPCSTEPVFDENTKDITTCSRGCNIPTLEVKCEEGFYFSDGSSVKTYTCQCDGWGDIENCTKIACDPLTIMNADVELPGPHTYPTVVNVTCKRGYNTLDEQQSYQTECRSDGTWSKNYSCVAKGCAAVAQNNTKLKDGMLPPLSYPMSIIAVCESGFLTSEAADCYEAMCLEDGTWNLTDACDHNATYACPATPIFNTMQLELPRTVDGGTFDVQCSGSETVSNGDTSYTVTCTSGAWDMATSCGMFTCEDIHAAGTTTSGVYTINPDGLTPMEVYCQNDLDEKGWTVIQQRLDASTDFYLNWTDYKAGFGSASSNYWLGLDNMRLLTQGMDKTLRVYMRHPDTTLGPNGDGYAWADYGIFYLDTEANKYTLHVDNFTDDGGAGESLFLRHDGQPFTTKDMDNDPFTDAAYDDNCAIAFKGGWWYGACHRANLNGLYFQTAKANGMSWYPYSGHDLGLTFVQMMIKTGSG